MCDAGSRYAARDEVLAMVNGCSDRVCVVSGSTGCGKTTQVPQFILEDAIKRGAGADCNIVVTQPRRISAIGVAERAAAERCEVRGMTLVVMGGGAGERMGVGVQMQLKCRLLIQFCARIDDVRCAVS